VPTLNGPLSGFSAHFDDCFFSGGSVTAKKPLGRMVDKQGRLRPLRFAMFALLFGKPDL
jgi:hypothetical protein